jgi:hypothetical protein
MKHIESSFRKKLLFLILWISSIIMPSCSDSSVLYFPINIDKNKAVNYVLIHKDKLLPGNEALILTDKSDIQEMVSLLSDNEKMAHACGYHWMFWFQYSLLSASTLAHNQDCEEYRHYNRQIHRLFHGYFKRITEDPSHFLYTFRIDARYEPEVVASHFMKDDVYVFCFRPESRLPHIRLYGTARIKIEENGDFVRRREEVLETTEMLARAKLNEASLTLQKMYKVQKISEPQHKSSSLKKEEVTQTFEIIVYFDFDQQLEGVKDLLDDVEIVETTTPLEYMIQLAFPVGLNAEQMAQLQKKYDFIHAIESFNSR